MKLVLRVIGVVLAVIGCIFLFAGRSVATDPIGIIVLLVMGGLPLALGVFLIYKSMKASSDKASSPAPAPTPANDPMPNTEPVSESVTVSEAAPKTEVSDDSVNAEPDQKKKYKSYAFKVAGISRRQIDITDNILTESYEYSLSKRELADSGMLDERIYKYDPEVTDADLIPEPDNPKDPNAIKVSVYDIQIGYVPAEKAETVHKLLSSKQIHSITCEFYGGPFKVVSEDYDDENDKEIYTVEKESQYVGAEITIEYE